MDILLNHLVGLVHISPDHGLEQPKIFKVSKVKLYGTVIVILSFDRTVVINVRAGAHHTAAHNRRTRFHRMPKTPPPQGSSGGPGTRGHHRPTRGL